MARTSWSRSQAVPLACAVGLLALIALEGLGRPRAEDAEPYHARVREAALRIPTTIGAWQGRDVEVERAAVALLRPNAILQRRYRHARTGASVDFLLVQCATARDMGGHYPPVCYPSQGWEAVSSVPGDWPVFKELPGPRGAEDGVLRGMEYTFRRTTHEGVETWAVRNLVILPSGRYERGIEPVRAAGGDYLRQYYGAAQIQVVFDADRTSGPERDAIFADLMGANRGLLEALTSGGTR